MNNISVLAVVAIAIYVMKRWDVETAILCVYFPVLLLVPSFYGMRIPHLPGVGVQGAALLPIIFVILISKVPAWDFRRTDLWVLLFSLEAGYSEYLNTGFGNGFFDFAGHIEVVVLPYLLGRIMLEQPGMRQKAVRRIVILVTIAIALSFGEFVTGKNIFYIIGRRLFTSGFIWSNQERYGFVRIKGPYAGSIHAGLSIMIAILMTLWLRMIDSFGGRAADPRYLRIRRSTWILVILGIGSIMTLSRGPWLGLALGLLIAWVGRSRQMGRAVVVAAALCIVGGIFLQTKGKEYTSSDGDSMSETQQSAAYRVKAFQLYEPIAEKGGLFGWGIATFPRVKGMDSIDNEYLLLRVSQGKAGYTLFLLLFFEAGLTLCVAVYRAQYKHDIFFYMILGGAVAGLMLTYGTVYTTGQTTVLFFMLLGWIQSLQETPPPPGMLEPVGAPRFGFKRVFA